MSNPTNDPQVTPLITPGPFPTWPPPSGGAPNTTWELGPVTNPTPYGSAQQSTINIAPPIPLHPYSSTFFPKKMATGASGQNQGQQQLPAWPKNRDCVLPDKAPPSVSAISPPPIMGPGSSQPHLLQSQVGRLGTVGRSFPAGSYIDGYGNLVTPTGVVRTIGGLGN
jgi:hypothetical protein